MIIDLWKEQKCKLFNCFYGEVLGGGGGGGGELAVWGEASLVLSTFLNP